MSDNNKKTNGRRVVVGPKEIVEDLRETEIIEDETEVIQEEVIQEEVIQEEVIQEEVIQEDLPPHIIVDEKKAKVDKDDKLPNKGTVVNCNLLRLREGASLKSKELVQIRIDTVVNIDHNNSTQSFYAVNYDGLSGFCLKEYIKLG